MSTADQVIKEVAQAHDLKHVQPVVKNVLPSAGDIAVEKAPALAAEFDKTQLNHIEPNVKVHLPEGEEYARDKVISAASTFDQSQLNHVEPEVKTQVVVTEK